MSKPENIKPNLSVNDRYLNKCLSFDQNLSDYPPVITVPNRYDESAPPKVFRKVNTKGYLCGKRIGEDFVEFAFVRPKNDVWVITMFSLDFSQLNIYSINNTVQITDILGAFFHLAENEPLDLENTNFHEIKKYLSRIYDI